MLPDAECVRLLVDILNACGLDRFLVKINHRKLLDGIMDVCGVPAEQHRTICSSIDKLDKQEWSEVRHEMIDTKGLNADAADRIGEFVRMHGDRSLVEQLRQMEELRPSASAQQALDDIDALLHYCSLLGVAPRLISFDLSLARGLDYYTGVIYEAVLDGGGGGEPNELFESVGSIAGGGRYDDLVASFDAKGQPVPCVGLSIGIERIFAIIEARQQRDDSGEQQRRTTDTEIYVVSAQKGLHEERLRLVAALWDAGIKVLFVCQPL